MLKKWLARLSETDEQRDERRLREIAELRRSGVETWNDVLEEHQIRRRRAMERAERAEDEREDRSRSAQRSKAAY